MKNLYGEIKLDKSQLLESNSEYMELEYYKIKNIPSLVKEEECTYGIQVIKNEYKGGRKISEANEIKYITKNEELVNKVIKTMKDNQVTPCCLEDTVMDYLKSQENLN